MGDISERNTVAVRQSLASVEKKMADQGSQIIDLQAYVASLVSRVCEMERQIAISTALSRGNGPTG